MTESADQQDPTLDADLVFLPLAGMLFTVVTCGGCWVMTGALTFGHLLSRLHPLALFAGWGASSLVFVALTAGSVRRPLTCGLIGVVAYAPSVVPAFTLSRSLITHPEQRTVEGLAPMAVSLVPVMLEVALMAATGWVFLRRSRLDRSS